VPQQRSTEIKVGIFVAICLVLIAGMIIRFGKYTRFAEKTYEITVVFPNVGGLVRDASVLYGGIAVGKVRDIRLDQEGLLKVHVSLAIYEGVKIRKDAKFVINQAGLLGDRYVDVIPQSGTAEFLRPGDVVEGSASVDLSEAIRGVVDVLKQTAGTIERVDKAIARIDETVLNRDSLQHISTAMANIDSATRNTVALTASLTGIVEENRARVEETLRRFSDASENLSAATRQINSVVAESQHDIRAAARNLAQSTERLNTILARLERGEGALGKALVDPTLHDEIVQLVQNWRRYGLLYKEGARRAEQKRGKPPVPARPAQAEAADLIFGQDLTAPAR
jgi:phospholipid/cholesterol/gamma-HCH transport system substrate-binding protein